MSRQVVDLGSHELQLRVAGEGPALLFTSTGYGIGVGAYEKLAPLEERFTVAWLDPRGTRPSTRPPDDGWSLDAMVEDFDQVREQLGWDAMWVAGHSMGGHLALRYAARFPERCLGVVGLCTYGAQDELYASEMQTRAAARQEEPWFGAFMEAAQGGAETDEQFGQMLGGMLPMYFVDQKRCAEFAEALSRVELSVDAFGYLGENKGMSILDEAEKVRSPVVLVCADQDWICSPALARRLDESLATSVVIELEGCGHFPWVERPQEFWDRLNEALDGAAPGRGRAQP